MTILHTQRRFDIFLLLIFLVSTALLLSSPVEPALNLFQGHSLVRSDHFSALANRFIKNKKASMQVHQSF